MDEILQTADYWKKMDSKATTASKKNLVIEIWKNDSELLSTIVNSITSNKQLAWMIVSKWLVENHKIIIDDPNPPD
jgi:hypothetical protein